MSQRDEVLMMLAKLKGACLMIDMYDHPAIKQTSQLSQEEVVTILKVIEKEGLVASIYERLDGPLYSLSENGRALMKNSGFEFDEEKVERTRGLFNEYFCKTPI